ncbi:AAA domain-containing protein [Lophiotrema nucula]|uniref:AAA domain-containing protein n=1 Tax=Lophiotrema nucula TaxID=690887 RepID=A0A6A5ZND9_9PLEO|nr:AAA domain-containing protein [Lophiotrema nucula]
MSGSNRFGPISGQNDMDESFIGFDDMMDFELETPVAAGTFQGAPTAASAPAPRHSFEELKELPNEWKFKECADREPNPYVKTPVGNADLVHRDYRQKDSPSFVRDARGNEPMPAIVMFNDQAQTTSATGEPIHVDQQVPVTIGYLADRGTPDAAEKEKVSVRLSFLTNTQFSAARLHIKRPKGEVQFRVFGPWIQRDTNQQKTGFGITEMRSDGSDQAEAVAVRIHRNHPQLSQYTKAHDLVATKMMLYKPGTKSDKGISLRPQFYGIKRTEVDEICKKFAAGEELREDEILIARLSSTTNFTVFRRIDKPQGADPTKFFSYMKACMFLNIMHGCLWFYRLQAPDVGLMDAQFPLDSLEVPRWLVKTWRATKPFSGDALRKDANETAGIIAVDPLTWTPFNGILEYPDLDSAAFMGCLAMVRDQQHSQALIKRMYSSDDGALEAQFRSNPKPATETELKLTCRLGKRDLVFQGQVLDDMFGSQGSGFDMVAGVVGPDADLTGKRLPVTLELMSDPTTTDRAINCIGHMAQGVERDYGVDFCHFLLGAPPSIPADKTSSLRARLGENKVARTNANLGSNYGLNEPQVDAAMAPITAPNGVNLTWGPAGTGKTRTMAASIAEMASLETPVIIACSGNDAVEKALEECLTAKPDLKAVRFVSGSRSSKRLGSDKSPSNDTPMESNDNDGAASEPLDETWELYLELCEAKETAHPELLFHVLKLKEIENWSNTEGHAKFEDAKSYLSIKAELMSAKPKATRKSLKAQLSDLDEDLTAYFWQHCVEALFVTWSSAPNDQLWSYKPRIGWIDEAGQANLGDLCMAWAPFKNSLESANLGGDFVELGPVATSHDANEALYAQSVSLFQSLIQDKNATWPYHMLKVTYRSCLDVTRFANETFYKGLLENHESTLIENGLQKTLRQFLANLNNAWNGEMRIAIDVNGEAHHKRFGTTMSLCNEKEADIIARLISKLTKFEPVDDGKEPKAVKIMPGHCGVYTVYKGQARLIGQKLRELGIRYSKKMSKDPTVVKFCTTTYGVQGGDVDFGFISNVSRDPQDANKKIKFLGDSKNQAVNLTRARWGDFAAANFGDLVAVMQNQNMEVRAKATLLHTAVNVYRKFIEHVHDRKSIISSLDIEEALLDDKPKVLQVSRYRKAHPEPIKSAKGQGTQASAQPVTGAAGSTGAPATASNRPGFGRSEKKRPHSTGQTQSSNAAPNAGNKKQKKARIPKQADTQGQQASQPPHGQPSPYSQPVPVHQDASVPTQTAAAASASSTAFPPLPTQTSAFAAPPQPPVKPAKPAPEEPEPIEKQLEGLNVVGKSLNEDKKEKKKQLAEEAARRGISQTQLKKLQKQEREAAAAANQSKGNVQSMPKSEEDTPMNWSDEIEAQIEAEKRKNEMNEGADGNAEELATTTSIQLQVGPLTLSILFSVSVEHQFTPFMGRSVAFSVKERLFPELSYGVVVGRSINSRMFQVLVGIIHVLTMVVRASSGVSFALQSYNTRHFALFSYDPHQYPLRYRAIDNATDTLA